VPYSLAKGTSNDARASKDEKYKPPTLVGGIAAFERERYSLLASGLPGYAVRRACLQPAGFNPLILYN